MRLVTWPKIAIKKCQNLIVKNHPNHFNFFFSLNNINLRVHFLFLIILCSIKIERLLFLKFLKIKAFFDSYFWPFYKSEEKIKVIPVISAIMPSIRNAPIKFR